MGVDRRIFLSGFAAALVMPRRASAATVTHATGMDHHRVEHHVTRVYPAGRPGAVTLDPPAPRSADARRIEPPGPEAREFLLPEIAGRPELPCTAPAAAMPPISTPPSSRSSPISSSISAMSRGSSRRSPPASSKKSGIPYALLDGHFDQAGATYRALGKLIGRGDDAEKLARSAETTIATKHN